MAIITKIREKSGLAVGVIGLGLAFFIVGSDIFSPNSVLFGGKKDIVGTIAGEEITLQQFNQEVEQIKSTYAAQTNQMPGEEQMPALRRQAWSQLILQIAYQKEYDDLGIMVTDEEVVDMVQGNNIHAGIASSFKNPETGEVDRQAIKMFLANLDRQSPQAQFSYYNFEKNLRPERKRQKLENMLAMSSYATDAEAQVEYTLQNAKATFNFVYVPYNSVVDSVAKPTDAQLKAYYNEHKNQYEHTATRSLEYVTFPIKYTADDRQEIYKETKGLISLFETTENDTAFVEANSDGNNSFKAFAFGEIPAAIDPTTAVEGSVYGPVQDGDTYKLYKVLGKSEDTVLYAKASHILIKPEGDDDAAALKEAKKVQREIKGGLDFAEAAAKYSDGPTKTRGGDLGWFKEGAMVPEFNDAVMEAKKLGMVSEIVKTQFGYHIINITGLPTSEQLQVAIIEKEIVASEETVNRAYLKSAKFARAKDYEGFKTNVEKDSGLIRLQAHSIAPEARNINNISGSNVRQIIRWSFNDETEIGQVSEVFELDDQFVVAVVTAKKEKGMSSFEDVKDRVANEVKNQLKKDYIIAKLKGLSGTVNEIAAAYGAGAISNEVEDFSFNSNYINRIGYSPSFVGKLLTIEAGKTSAPIADETNGVVIVEMVSLEKPVESADYTLYKSQLEDRESRSVSFKLNQAIEEFAGVENNLYKFY